MHSSSEIILTITIWTLTGAGLFFGTKAALRRRKEKKRGKREGEACDL